MYAFDEVRKGRWRAAYENTKQLTRENPQKRGSPKTDDETIVKVQNTKAKVSEIKNSGYTLGKAPVHTNENQGIRLNMIQANDSQLYRTYFLKESLKLLLKLTDINHAEAGLEYWLWWASHSIIQDFKELKNKIERPIDHILNTIRLGLNNAKIEANNNIKLIIHKAYEFRNIQNMTYIVYLIYSNIHIPLSNRKSEPQKVA